MINKTIIIAEAGVNHNGSLDLAKKLIDKKKRGTKPNERTGGKPRNIGIGGALKQKRALRKAKVKSRKRNFSDFLDFEDFN